MRRRLGAGALCGGTVDLVCCGAVAGGGILHGVCGFDQLINGTGPSRGRGTISYRAAFLGCADALKPRRDIVSGAAHPRRYIAEQPSYINKPRLRGHGRAVRYRAQLAGHPAQQRVLSAAPLCGAIKRLEFRLQFRPCVRR